MAQSLDRRITISRPQEQKSAIGETIATGWEEVATIWAAYAPISDGERLRAAAVEQKTDARFTVRYSARLAGIDGTHQIQFDGSDWQITGIKEIGRRRRLEITAWRLVVAVT
jgi:SPP1 family predicted phage head-tail adaptor